KEYRFSFREQLDAVAAALSASEAKKSPSKDFKIIQAERKAGRIVPFIFFAMYPEPIPEQPERYFEALKHRLETFFDQQIVVRG
ncbi:MAG: hypothetical protein ACYSX0_07680, partial [Planctomycetota bacterium]